MTRKHSISQYSGIGVRITPLLLVALLLAASTQAAATSEQSSMWHDARTGGDGGVIGALEMTLTNETTEGEITLDYSEMTPVIEVYTATWCLNCVTTEHAIDEAVGDSDVIRIHYHRHRAEPEDPFGNNATEHRWESTYGDASTAETGMSSGPFHGVRWREDASGDITELKQPSQRLLHLPQRWPDLLHRISTTDRHLIRLRDATHAVLVERQPAKRPGIRGLHHDSDRVAPIRRGQREFPRWLERNRRLPARAARRD